MRRLLAEVNIWAGSCALSMTQKKPGQTTPTPAAHLEDSCDSQP